MITVFPPSAKVTTVKSCCDLFFFYLKSSGNFWLSWPAHIEGGQAPLEMDPAQMLGDSNNKAVVSC